MENKEDITQRIKEAKVMFNNKKRLLCSNILSLEMRKGTYKKLYLECCCLWIGNMDRGESEERVVNVLKRGAGEEC
jgi:hypothetical protein